MKKTTKPTTWNNETLDKYRLIMDPPADKAIISLYESVTFMQDRNFLREMATNDTFVPGSLPQPIQDFLKTELAYKYSTAEIASFKRARDIWKNNGVQFIFVLFFRALPYTYMAEKPANVLRLTKLLEAHPTRRILETAQFIFDVMDKEWWEPGSRGVMTALKIRLMHSAMRYNLLNNPGDEAWNKEAWGMPISQEDLLATNQVFSLEFIKGMEIMGEPLTAQQSKDWFTTWTAIGRIMGIQSDMLSDDIPSGWELQKAVYDHLFPDDNSAGIALAKALVETLSTFLLSTKMVLIMMRKMILDEEHPDLFYRVLGPSYGRQYPNIFAATRDAEGTATVDKLLEDEFHTELEAYKERVIAFRAEQKANEPSTRGDSNFKHLIDYQLDVFDELSDEMDPNNPATRGVGTFLLKKAMGSIGSVIIGMLSTYFRTGKMTDFRIPSDLKEHWAL